MARLTVLDASILIAVIDSSDGWAADADQIIAAADRLGVGTLTLAESLVRSVEAGKEAELVTGLRRLGIDELPMPAGTAPELARLRGATKLKMPDCYVLHTAIEAGANALATRDPSLRRWAAHYGLDTP